jgi:hypothetical protein
VSEIPFESNTFNDNPLDFQLTQFLPSNSIRTGNSAEEYTVDGPIVFVMLTVRRSSSSASNKHHIPKFSLNLESIGDKLVAYRDYTFSQYKNSFSPGNVEFPEQINPDSLSRKYKPTEIATFTINTLPIVDNSLTLNITRMDLELKSNCSADSLTFLIPSPYDHHKRSITKYGPQDSDFR